LIFGETPGKSIVDYGMRVRVVLYYKKVTKDQEMWDMESGIQEFRD